MTLLDPTSSLVNLIYIGYNGNPAAALHVTRRRSVDRKKQTTLRNVFQCYVFGSKHSEKSALLHSLLGTCASEPIIIVEHPHLSIPESEIARKKKQHNHLLHHSLTFALAGLGAAMAVAGLTAYRARSVRKKTTAEQSSNR
ncbi:hypothetical protein Fmac_027930 [Flemingia macrophylla]|uniref:Mitochondrial Rho GTPase 1/3 EF hand associated type-1 domain-containing protein n=1 Tax=Flemingia macrophylla TaxID=520843 RepID=A0ABD1LJ98_9FABA